MTVKMLLCFARAFRRRFYGSCSDAVPSERLEQDCEAMDEGTLADLERDYSGMSLIITKALYQPIPAASLLARLSPLEHRVDFVRVAVDCRRHG